MKAAHALTLAAATAIVSGLPANTNARRDVRNVVRRDIVPVGAPVARPSGNTGGTLNKPGLGDGDFQCEPQIR